jgi:hypothetical protein
MVAREQKCLEYAINKSVFKQTKQTEWLQLWTEWIERDNISLLWRIREEVRTIKNWFD